MIKTYILKVFTTYLNQQLNENLILQWIPTMKTHGIKALLTIKLQESLLSYNFAEQFKHFLLSEINDGRK